VNIEEYFFTLSKAFLKRLPMIYVRITSNAPIECYWDMVLPGGLLRSVYYLVGRANND